MRAVSRVLLTRQGGGKIPNLGSSLLNPRSARSRQRQAMAAGAAEQQFFDQQAMFADVGGSGGEHCNGGKRPRRAAGSKKSKAQRKTHHVVERVGAEVADRARHMTDSEWESVALEDKHAFTKYMAKLLRERPTEATEQQRRRYFETTMADPRDLDPNATVQDEYERLKLGLPVQLKNPQRSLGVSQALYDAAEPSLFDPANAHRLENAMTEVKQVFTDYVEKRRAGTSTENERRRLANLTADLNVETQRHLASMFKYTEERIRGVALAERQQQLSELERLKGMLSDNGTNSTNNGNTSVGKKRRGSSRTRLTTAQRKAKLTASVSKAIGLDVAVVRSLLEELDAQEKFMQFCEVFARLTVGRGFAHSAADEGLDAYTDSLRRLYSVDAHSLSTLDAVQYLAAKEDAHPVEWARRWYERALLVPLQRTQEYQRLEAIQQTERAALLLQRNLSARDGGGGGNGGSSSVDTPSASSSTPSSGGDDAGTSAARELSAEAAGAKQAKVVRLVEKMFLRPDDPRLETLHQRRLRYLAYLQMERQIAQARENAKLFAGVEATPEAVECHELYRQLMERRQARGAIQGAGDEKDNNTGTTAVVPSEADGDNIFAVDPAAADLFDRMSAITTRVIADTKARKLSEEGVRVRSRATERAKRVAAFLEEITSNTNSGGGAELRAMLAEKKEQVSRRLLGIVERDVRTEVEWLEAMAEAERPPLLPIPEGMSYVSAAEVGAWKDIRAADEKKASSPFEKKQRAFQPALLGQTWTIPDKPMLFWGTGTRAVQQALKHAAADADRKRRGEPLAPPYPCPENPWGWRLVKDVLDD